MPTVGAEHRFIGLHIDGTFELTAILEYHARRANVAVDIAAGRSSELKLGNIDIARDWGWAPEYVEAMWMMLQQSEPEDYIVATGKTYALRDFVQQVFKHLNLDWQQYTSCDSDFLRPTDIQISRANPSKAESFLGWRARYDMHDVARMMVDTELKR